MRMPNDDRPTLPPSKADQATQEFETFIHESGEHQARWVRLMTLLAETFGTAEAGGEQSEAA